MWGRPTVGVKYFRPTARKNACPRRKDESAKFNDWRKAKDATPNPEGGGWGGFMEIMSETVP